MLAAQCSLNAVKVIGYKVETCNGDYEAAAVRGKQHNRRCDLVVLAQQIFVADLMLTSAFLQEALRPYPAAYM
nr:hypothetical transcript [Hymenolepis microstoma]